MNREAFITSLIEDSGMSQRAFAEKIGLSYSTLRSMLRNGIGGTGVDTVLKICEELDIKVEDLKKDKSTVPQKTKPKILQKMKLERIKAGLTPKDIYKRLAIPELTLIAWEAGEGNLDSEDFVKLCKLYNIDSFSDIMKNDDNEANNLSLVEEAHIKKYRALDKHGKEIIDYVLNIEYKRYEKIENAQHFCPNKSGIQEEVRQIPLVTLPIEAGEGTFFDSYNYKIISIDNTVPINATFGIKISGNSMEPKIYNGDIAWVKVQPYLENGQIGIFILNGKWFCKKYYIENNMRMLLSFNKNEKDIALNDNDQFKIVGRVVSLTSGE